MSGSATAERGSSPSPPREERAGERRPFQSSSRQRALKLRPKQTPSILPYKNPKLSAAERTADLLSRMTLQEKAAQMMCIWQQKADKLVDAEGKFDLAKARVAFKAGHGIGQIGRPSDAGSPPGEPWLGQTPEGMAQLTNAIQKF